MQLHVQFVLWSGPMKTKLFHKRLWLKMFTLIETKIKNMCSNYERSEEERQKKTRDLRACIDFVWTILLYNLVISWKFFVNWSLAQFQSYVRGGFFFILCKITKKPNETKWKVTQVLKSIRQARTPSTIFAAQKLIDHLMTSWEILKPPSLIKFHRHFPSIIKQ